MTSYLHEMMSRVAQLGQVSEEEAQKILSSVYADGLVNRAEIEALFRISGALTDFDPKWAMRFQEAVKDYLLVKELPTGWITEEEADWLISQLNQGDRRPNTEDLDLVLHVLRYAEGAPARLGRFALVGLCEQVSAAGVATAEMTERIRRALFAPAGDSGLWVSRFEATYLFQTNDAVGFAQNDPSWNDLFARAIANHLLARTHPDPVSEAEALSREVWLKNTNANVSGMLGRVASSIGSSNWFDMVTHSEEKAAKARAEAKAAADRKAAEIETHEGDWLLDRLRRDELTTPAERALIDFLNAEIPGFTSGLVEAA